MHETGIAPRRLPILVAGAGAMGGAMIEGWRKTGGLSASDLIVCDPRPSEQALSAARAGAALNPAAETVASARTVIFTVKPQAWRAVAAELAPRLAADAALISVVAGVHAGDLSQAFGRRPIARVMPTLAVAIGQGSIALWSDDRSLADETAALMAPLGAVARIASEDLMHVATAACGSAPAYLYAFIEALESAATDGGLPPDLAAQLVRAAVCGAAALLARGAETPGDLRQKVTSPGGTTQAALEALAPELGPLVARAVNAAVARSRELGR